jgi:uncharacterized protein GlcG (DUF336 family)
MRIRVFVVIAILLSVCSPALRAQLGSRKTLTLDAAKKIASVGVEEAKKDKSAGAIAIVDDGGNLVYVERLDGTFPAASNISIGKARTAAIFKRPTAFFEDVIAKGRTAMTALQDFTPLQGGVPITVDGQIIGAVGVSGANSALRDNEIALAAAEAGNSLSSNLMPDEKQQPVTYFDQEKVRDSFLKGEVLFNASSKYMVHTSKREVPGMAEVHLKDADIIYVQDGSATFITGGTVVDGKTTAPDEIRGREIQGGDTRTIVKGDVIIVPAGTPHWFKEVPKPMTYFVVKAR